MSDPSREIYPHLFLLSFSNKHFSLPRLVFYLCWIVFVKEVRILESRISNGSGDHFGLPFLTFSPPLLIYLPYTYCLCCQENDTIGHLESEFCCARTLVGTIGSTSAVLLSSLMREKQMIGHVFRVFCRVFCGVWVLRLYLVCGISRN